MSSDSNQNNHKRAGYVVRETPVPLPSYVGVHKSQTSSAAPAPALAQIQQPQQPAPLNGQSLEDPTSPAVKLLTEPTDNSNTMSSSGRQLRSRQPAPPAPPPPAQPPSKKRKATSSRTAPEPAQEPVQQVQPPLPQDGNGEHRENTKDMPILRPPHQTVASPPQGHHADDIYRMPPLPPYLSAQPRICEPADNYRGWTTPLDFSYKMPVHPLTFYGSFDIWFEQVQKMAEANNCSIELNTRIGKFPDPGTVEAFICQTRFLSCWRILHGTISGAYWAYMRVLGYSRIPVFTGAPDDDNDGGEAGGGVHFGSGSVCQWQPQPSDCVYFALEVRKRVLVPSSDQQPRYQTMRMVEEVRSAKVSDYPSAAQYREGMAWLKEVLNGMILKGDRQVCESMYDRKPDWAPEWPEVPAGGDLEPPWALKGSPLRAEDALGGDSNGTAGASSSSRNAGHIWQQQHQPHQQQQESAYQIDPRLEAGPSDHHQQPNNNHAIARLAPMSVSSSDGDYSYGGDNNGSVDYTNNNNNNNHHHNNQLIFMDGTTASAAAVAAAEAHGLSGPGPSRSHHHQQENSNNDGSNNSYN